MLLSAAAAAAAGESQWNGNQTSVFSRVYRALVLLVMVVAVAADSAATELMLSMLLLHSGPELSRCCNSHSHSLSLPVCLAQLCTLHLPADCTFRETDRLCLCLCLWDCLLLS